jgi:hypothetical protein
VIGVLYDTAARRRLLSLLAQKKVAKETAPKFGAKKIGD